MPSLIKAFVFGFAVSMTAMPAAATLTVVVGNSPQPDQAVLLSTGESGNPVTGVTNGSGFLVTILGTENLTLPAAGLQVIVDAADGNLTYLSFSLADLGYGFSSLILNLDAEADGFVGFNAVHQIGGSSSGLFALDGSGQNFFTLTNSGGQLFTALSFTTTDLSFTSTVNIADVSSIRLGGIAPLNGIPAVPEPGTWSYMLLGFGAVGWSLRSARRRNLKMDPVVVNAGLALRF